MRESAFGVGAIDVCMCKVPQGEHVHRMLHAETGKCLHHISRPRKLPAILASGENEGQLRTPLTAATAERPLPACSLEPCLSPDYKSCPPDPGRALYTVPDVWLAVESGPGGRTFAWRSGPRSGDRSLAFPVFPASSHGMAHRFPGSKTELEHPQADVPRPDYVLHFCRRYHVLLDSLGALHVGQTLQEADLLLFWLLVPSLPKAGYRPSGLENQGV